MRQRVMIAMALSCNSKLLIADEPTTALDVTIQAQILDLMKKVRNDFSASIMLITHDLGVVADLADDVIVMYAGKIVEKAAVRHIYKNPKHPYTQGLLGSIPKLTEVKERLHVIEGTVPNPFCMPEGCRFNPRCRYAKDICIQKQPPLMKVEENHEAACWMLTDYKETAPTGKEV
jgi:oligopeptide/dipeptide ABC transporter ATP-binding protein